jgi:hypothetical protein
VVDVSFSGWYEQGSTWINHSLPMFVVMDRKPEDGFKIHKAACGITGVMIQLKLIKTARKQQAEEEDDSTIINGTKVLLMLVQPWYNSNRVVCADTNFTSARRIEIYGCC